MRRRNNLPTLKKRLPELANEVLAFAFFLLEEIRVGKEVGPVVDLLLAEFVPTGISVPPTEAFGKDRPNVSRAIIIALMTLIPGEQYLPPSVCQGKRR